ncbi:MAG: short-chain dehydrogenase, partial [Bacteroidota bacterium]|nr:short-chain dehydrogenase [Bacteroidota bacterium]
CPGQTHTNFQKNVSSKKNRINFSSSSPEKVAKYGYESLKNNITLAVPGYLNKLIVFLNRILPRSISTNIVRFIQEKNRN